MIRSYHSILSKPVDLFCTNALIYTSIESFHLASTYVGWPMSIIATTIGFRLMLYPIGSIFDKITWRLPKPFQGFAEKQYKNFLLNDLEHDVRKLNLKSSDLDKLKLKIKPSVLMRQLVQFYLSLNFARGLSHISLNHHSYPEMSSLFLFWSISLPDPFFVFPIVSGYATYKVLQKSFHPFTITLQDSHKFWSGFLVSLFFIPLPVSFSLSYWSFLSVHLALQKIKIN